MVCIGKKPFHDLKSLCVGARTDRGVNCNDWVFTAILIVEILARLANLYFFYHRKSVYHSKLLNCWEHLYNTKDKDSVVFLILKF